MAKKFRSQTLRDRIDKTIDQDGLDLGWADHFQELTKTLSTVGKAEHQSLLSQESAQAAVVYWADQEAKLNKISKQIKAVKSLLEQTQDSDTRQDSKIFLPDNKKPSDSGWEN